MFREYAAQVNQQLASMGIGQMGSPSLSNVTNASGLALNPNTLEESGGPLQNQPALEPPFKGDIEIPPPPSPHHGTDMDVATLPDSNTILGRLKD